MIPGRFRDEVEAHLVLSLAEDRDHPVIMGIFGPPGEGKTYQLRTILDESGVLAYSVSAADLESDLAGAPGKLLLTQYVTAASKIAEGRPAALLVDDIDTTVGEWVQNTGTVNHQTVLAQLMHFADIPTQIENVGVVRRVPVFATGNDFSKLYAPLRRPGRLAPFLWQPDPGERAEVVGSMFDGLLAPALTAELLDRHGDLPVAFFADLKSEIAKAASRELTRDAARDLAGICRDPAAFRKYLAASALRADVDRGAVLARADELAGLHAAVRTSYLDEPARVPTDGRKR